MRERRVQARSSTQALLDTGKFQGEVGAPQGGGGVRIKERGECGADCSSASDKVSWCPQSLKYHSLLCYRLVDMLLTSVTLTSSLGAGIDDSRRPLAGKKTLHFKSDWKIERLHAYVCHEHREIFALGF